jgi:hypothetical protein
MRLIILLFCLSASAIHAFAQGTIYFASHVSPPLGNVDALIWYNDLYLCSGDRFNAQLYAGTDMYNLKPYGTPTVFLTGDQAGYFDGGVVVLDGIEPGTSVFMQVYAWEATTGSSWETSLAKGISMGYCYAKTGGVGDPPSSPGFLSDLSPFSIYSIPEPSTLALFALLGLLLTFGRQKRIYDHKTRLPF